MARPTKFKAIYVKQVYKLALLGLTDVQMAEVLDVSEKTFNTWKTEHPAFLQSLKKGKIPADAEVAASLFERAKGYSHPDVHISNYLGSITKTKLTKHYPPDTAAAFIWLKNRQPERWRQEPDGSDADKPVAPVKIVVQVSDARRR